MSDKIYIASDHAGFELKQFLIEKLSQEYSVSDLGCASSETSVDYPDVAKDLCVKISDYTSFGILICGSGIGMSIAANRNNNVRAALCFDEELAKLARNHNDANVLCLGSRFISNDQASKIVDSFLANKFEAGRHENRVQKLSS